MELRTPGRAQVSSEAGSSCLPFGILASPAPFEVGPGAEVTTIIDIRTGSQTAVRALTCSNRMVDPLRSGAVQLVLPKFGLWLRNVTFRILFLSALFFSPPF